MHYYQHDLSDFDKYQKKRRSELPTVYALSTNDLKYIKVGFTNAVKQRVSNIQSGCPFELFLWIAIKTPKPKQVEHELHERLEDFKLRGEWFSPDENTLDWMLDYFTETNRNVAEIIDALL